MFDEKRNIIKVSKLKLNTYFANTVKTETNRLTALEEQSKREILRLKQRTAQSVQNEKQEILLKIEQLSKEINESIKKERELAVREQQNVRERYSNQFNNLAEENMSEEIIQKRMQQNQIEMKIGLNWINKLGILLIIIGVAAAFRYSYSNWFNDYVKGGLFFVVGLIMLGGGEWLHRRNKQVFALGVIGGGISILYGSIFFSYFLLKIIGLTPALLLSILVTALAVFLSLRYQSRTIISFGLIGGYIPFYSYLFAFGLEGYAVYTAMAYILILNMSILLISFKRQWSIVHYLSFVLNIPSLLVLILISASSIISLLYSILIFCLYLVLTIGYPFVYRVAIKWMDVALLAMNTFFSFLVIYFLFNELGWDDFEGLLAAAFCVLYFGLGRFVETRMNKQKMMIVLFYGTSITFAVLVIPFQFGVQWLSLGWLVEGVVIMLYANRYKLKVLERAGWGIFTLTLFTFLIEFLENLLWPVEFFHFKYMAIMAGLIIVMVYYALDQRKRDSTELFRGFSTFIAGFKYFTLVNSWIYLLHESNYLYDQQVAITFDQYWFYKWMLFAFITMGLGYGLKQIPLLYDRIVSYYCLLLYGLGSLIGLVVTFTIPALEPAAAQNTFLNYLALVILIGFNVLIFLIGRDLLSSYIREKYHNYELYPTILSVYFLGVLTAFLNVQFQLGDAGFVISLVFLAVAVAYILYGFKYRYVYIRRIGLGLSLLSTGKLFLLDLAFLTESSKILAYFCFGLTLLGISYIYQKVSSHQKEIEDKEEKNSE
ncbi:DUF2339 domain-containing protein [Jeotgalibacillus proteolyticus]|uniref:DUF2339 domain-containing protein n=2 Tax=Jeotgalibacillus proteolyticus TaxID=2082395 RepID=A0A2S5GC69_9BACL|nr:DUF2339 domain-containing protein [Jeotgalibacillus proteolyticus]